MGWAEEGFSRAGTLVPVPRRPAPPAAPPSPPPHPQTRASGPAALTARPWPERSEGLQNPPRAAVEAAARDSLLGWVRGRPLLGGGGEGRGAGRGLTAAARKARGRGGRLGPDWDWLLAAAPPGSGRGRLAALRWAFLTRPGTGEAELGGIEDGHRAPRNAAIISRAAILSTAASSSLETQRGTLGSSPEQECRAGDQAETPKGQEQGCPETPLDPKEDASCATCSSSSESEPEGFFLGQRLPRPWETPGNLQAGDSDTSRKHCTIC